MLDIDEVSPHHEWEDERVVAWARSRKLDRYPRAFVPLMSASRLAPNEAEIDFTVSPPKVSRYISSSAPSVQC